MKGGARKKEGEKGEKGIELWTSLKGQPIRDKFCSGRFFETNHSRVRWNGKREVWWMRRGTGPLPFSLLLGVSLNCPCHFWLVPIFSLGSEFIRGLVVERRGVVRGSVE